MYIGFDVLHGEGVISEAFWFWETCTKIPYYIERVYVLPGRSEHV